METKEIKLFGKQWDAYSSPARFILASAGIQGGKTFLGCIWMLSQIQKYPNDYHLIAAPTYKILQQSTLPKFRELVPSTVLKFKEQDSYFDIIGGTGKVFVRSTEDPDTLEGMTLRSAWLDEAGNMKKRVWIIIQGRTAIKQGQILMTTSPYTMNWVYYDVLKNAEKETPGFAAFQWMSIDNPTFPKEEFARVQNTISSTDFDRRYKGLWRHHEGLVYQDFNPLTMTFEGPPKAPVNEVIAGVDWGYQHPASIVVVGIGDKPTHIVLDEFYKTKQTIDLMVKAAKELKERYGIKWFYADSARPEFIKDFNMAGLPTLEGNKEIVPGINEVRLRIKSNNLVVSKNCVNLLEELEMYSYPEEMDSEEPIKQYDHACDALRYAIYSYKMPGVVLPDELSPIWHTIKEEVKELQEEQEDDEFDTYTEDGLI